MKLVAQLMRALKIFLLKAFVVARVVTFNNFSYAHEEDNELMERRENFFLLAAFLAFSHYVYEVEINFVFSSGEWQKMFL
jgi:hypothetical protein